MNKLSHYKDNLFASHATMDSALEYVTMMANTFTTENSLAVITAARVVLNTAIEMHKAELAKANAPLLEMIEAQVQKSFTNVHNAIDQALDNFDKKVDDKIDDAASGLRGEIEDWIETAINDIDVEQQVKDYMESNPVDVQDLLSGACVSITFD